MDDIMLVNFAPLIQLWAGICLLFFYEPILKNFPLSKLYEEKQNLIVSFLGKYQAYLDDEKLMKGYRMIRTKRKRKSLAKTFLTSLKDCLCVN